MHGHVTLYTPLTCRYGGQVGFFPTLLFQSLSDVAMRDDNGTVIMDEDGSEIMVPNPRYACMCVRASVPGRLAPDEHY